MASSQIKQTCAKCNKGTGIAMCNGCQQSYCIKHFVEHRQELSQSIENIGQEHDLIRRDLNLESNTQTLFEHIHQWEEETIANIRTYTNQLRIDLQQLIEQTKNDIEISANKLANELRTCRELDDYTEIDIQRWNDQLKNLRQMIENSSKIHLQHENTSIGGISLIKLNNNQTSSTNSTERFSECNGMINLSEDGLVASGAGTRWDGSCVSGTGRYSSQIHRIRFRIENKKSSFLFFGIITASQNLTTNVSGVESLYGWWDLGFNVVSGKPRDTNQNRILQTGDEITLILDCDHRQIRFQHHRTDTYVDLPIDILYCPFPWKILLRLDSKHDCIKILE